MITNTSGIPKLFHFCTRMDQIIFRGFPCPLLTQNQTSSECGRCWEWGRLIGETPAPLSLLAEPPQFGLSKRKLAQSKRERSRLYNGVNMPLRLTEPQSFFTANETACRNEYTRLQDHPWNYFLDTKKKTSSLSVSNTGISSVFSTSVFINN